MEAAFLRATLADGDMKDVQSHYTAAAGRCFFVAERGVQVVGIVAAVRSDDGSSVELQRMSVARESRGVGVGGRLVLAVVDYAKHAGASRVTLGTLDVKVAAIRLYERHGFRQASRSRIPAETLLERFGVETDEAVHVLKYELTLSDCDGPSAAPAAAPAAAAAATPATPPVAVAVAGGPVAPHDPVAGSPLSAAQAAALHWASEQGGGQRVSEARYAAEAPPLRWEDLVAARAFQRGCAACLMGPCKHRRCALSVAHSSGSVDRNGDVLA